MKQKNTNLNCLLVQINNLIKNLFSFNQIFIEMPKGLPKYINSKYYIIDNQPILTVILKNEDDVINIKITFVNKLNNSKISFNEIKNINEEKNYYYLACELQNKEFKPFLNFIINSFNPYDLNIICI